VIAAILVALAVLAPADEVAQVEQQRVDAIRRGQDVARFVCSLAFGAAWTARGDRTALLAAAVALAVCAVFSFRLGPTAKVSV